MTPERQNEIWVILPHWFRKHLRDEYDKAKDALTLDPNNPRIKSHIRFMENYFGRHNLTAQAEEKPKEPKFNIGEKVCINCYSNGEVWDAVMHNRIVTIQDYYVKDGVNMYVLKEGCRDFGEHCLEPCTEPKEDVKTSNESDQNSQTYLQSADHIPNTTKMVDYAQYRLDLAKEIAVAMIKDDWATVSVTAVAADAIDMTNEIVKLLKETEE